MTDLATDPITAPFEGPFGGVPAFGMIDPSGFEAAISAAMAQALAEIDDIAGAPDAPTFTNTILPLERQGAALTRAGTYYGVWAGSLSDEALQAAEARIEPQFADYHSRIIQNETLFKRIEAVWQNKEAMALLTAEEQRLVWDYYSDYVQAGAALDTETKTKIGALNEQLSALFTKFSQNLLHDEEAYVTWLNADQLHGLPDSRVAAAAGAATEKGRNEGYGILNTRSSVEPFLTYAEDRDLRETVWRTFHARGDNGDAYDNKAIIAEILKLRLERANLQGYKSFAAHALEKQVAKTPAAAMALMNDVWPAAIARVREEVADMQAIADAEGAGITIAPWDYRYYAEKVRQDKFDLDADEVKQYLQLESLREGMFWMANQLYGFDFVPAGDLPVFHPDVRVWEVQRAGAHQGLFYFDPYARAGKRSGAWMTSYRPQAKMDGGRTVIVSNNANFIKAAPGEATLISWDDAVTLFHEFGHGLHGLCSDVTYPSLSGTAVPRDYVEFPSQVHENWLATPEILKRFALHHETGAPIPDALIEKIHRAKTFNQGFATTEYLACALVDMKLHMLEHLEEVDVEAIEGELLGALGMPAQLAMRHRLPQFAHIFSGDWYAAGYYAYLWADTFGADGWEAFEEAGSPFDSDTAQRFYDHVLSVGNMVDPTDGYAAFRGRPVDAGALMRQRGFGA